MTYIPFPSHKKNMVSYPSPQEFLEGSHPRWCRRRCWSRGICWCVARLSATSWPPSRVLRSSRHQSFPPFANRSIDELNDKMINIIQCNSFNHEYLNVAELFKSLLHSQFCAKPECDQSLIHRQTIQVPITCYNRPANHSIDWQSTDNQSTNRLIDQATNKSSTHWTTHFFLDEFPAKKPAEEPLDGLEVVDAEDPLEVVVELEVRRGKVDGLIHGSDEKGADRKGMDIRRL